MKHSSILVGTIAVLLVSAQGQGAAWGETGHRTVGRIAAALLTPKAQAKVAVILDVPNETVAVANALADAAEWPDDYARDHYPNTSEWHFIDLGAKPDAVLDKQLWDSSSTAFAKIVKYAESVRRGDPDELEPASDLEFLAHLVGDIHQPLHAATNKDRGGNCLFVRYPEIDGDPSGRTKLHAAMDDRILSDRLGKSDRTLAKHLINDAGLTSLRQRRNDIESELKNDLRKTVESWISESHSLAVTRLYQPLKPSIHLYVSANVDSKCQAAAPEFKHSTWQLDAKAVKNLSSLIEEQLVKAGIRLAALLNRAAD